MEISLPYSTELFCVRMIKKARTKQDVLDLTDFVRYCAKCTTEQAQHYLYKKAVLINYVKRIDIRTGGNVMRQSARLQQN